MRVPDSSRPNKPPCRFFNTPRGCNKGNNCPFAHVHSQPGSAQSARVSSPPQARFTERATSQPLSEAQIKTFHDATSDDLVPLHIAPTDVQDKLYPFLNQNFSFNHPKVVNNFARMLAASGSGDDRWTFTERSAFLSRLSDPNKAGLDRIKEILLMPIATRSAFSQDLLFQNGMVLIFMFFTSSTVVKTAVASSANLLYGIIDSYLVAILSASQEGVRQLIESRGHHLKGSDTTSMVQIFKPLILLINEYLNRFPAAALSHFDSITMFLSALASSLDQWAELFLDGSFQDQISCVGAARERWVNFIKKSLLEKIIKIQNTLEFAHSSATIRPLQTGPSSTARTVSVGEGQLQMLINDFDPPGLLRALGPRHNNDSVLIRDIVVHPTSQEIASTQAPYLPFNFIGAPHHLRSGSPEQLLDIHFRLLREELVEPLRSSMMALSQEIRSCGKGSTLQQLLNKGGGRFKAGNDCADLQVWGTGRLRFSDITCSDRHGILVTVGFEKQQSQKAWDFQLERLLNPGALVAVVQRVGEGEEVEVYLGLVRSHPAEIKDAVRSQMPAVKIEFFDKRAIHLAISPTSSTRLQLLVEVRGVLYESVAPFLRNLQETAPGQLSFAELLALPSSMPTSPVMVQPPSYAQSPAFSYNLSGLLREDSPRSSEGLYMTIDEEGRDNARAALKEHGIVDSTQADAVVDALSREVAIIQGPPGTGKSYVGVALINALLKSNASPILIVCMTNHALDSVLSKILEQDLTKKIVRLGSRSKDERVASYSLEALVAVRPKDDDRDAKREWRRFKTAQEDLLNDVSTMKKGSFDAAQVLDMAETINPIHAGRMKDPPTDLWPAISDWITWSSGKARGTHATMSSQPDAIDIFEFWRQGVDLELRQRQRSAPQEPKVKAQQSKGKEKETVAVQNRYEVLAEASDSESDEEELWPCDIEDDDDDDDDPFEPLELETDGSTEYTTDSVVAEESDEDPSQSNFALSWPEVKHRGSLELLQEDADVWTFSMEDRALLIDQWTNECRQVALSRLDDAYDKVQSTRKGVQEQRDKERLSILKTSHIIGATTNGAAKAADLLKSLKPKVLLVEEAGQVLEAHILATLNASVEHLILIGDHYQLRPQVTNFGLSMENKRGRGHLHRLDMSMMERLAEESKVPVSRIITQRRMRPEICDLVRPVQELEDHESVQNRGDIKGVAKNYFFLDHNHPESAQETSRTNEFEADMAFDLVCHLLNQGYVPNDICIIVAYLSQISKIKERLRRHQISIIVPDKDAAALADAEEGDHGADFHSEGVVVTQSVGTAVRVATVDNFQGEEAKIIILSLVRNRGVDSDEQLASSRFLRKGGIGFLKSQNRSYVALSRARDGLFVFGNAGLLHDHSPFWAAVLDRMEAQGAIVQGIPIICSHHPEKGVTEVSEAGKLRLLSPNGGCEEACGDVRRCGHICSAKCHPADSEHTLLPCLDDCARLLDCGHPCKKRCGERCGPCDFIVPVVRLECGHSAFAVPCAQVQNGQVWCSELVAKTLKYCGHQVTAACSTDESTIDCTEKCGETLPCCGRRCLSTCRQCTSLSKQKDASEETEGDSEQEETVGKPPRLVHRTRHSPHVCAKKRHCGHKCKELCKAEHQCKEECSERCGQRPCSHLTCSRSCGEPCQVCLAECEWSCKHGIGQCANPCGVPCERLPCDEPCDAVLKCGHPCPSICGEPCELQTCANCAPAEKRAQVVDFLMLSTLAEVDATSRELDARTITLACGHVFTVETLDGHFQMSVFYTKGPDGEWQRNPSLPTDFFTAFCCPACRSPASAMRYGRPKKRSCLDEQEKKHIDAANKTCKSLAERTAQLSVNVLAHVFGNHRSKKKIQGIKQHNLSHKGQKKFLMELARDSMPTPASTFANLLHFGFSQTSAVAWAESIEPVLSIIRVAERMLKQKNPHVQAWQAAIAQAHQRFLATLDPRDVRRDQKALQLARASVSFPEPQAESKYRLLSMFIILDARMVMAKLASTIGDDLQPKHKEEWARLAEFLLSTGSQDAEKALLLAEATLHGKEALRAQAYGVRFRTEVFINKLERSRVKVEEKLERSRAKVKKSESDVEKAKLEQEVAKLEGKSIELEEKAISELERLREDWRQALSSAILDAAFREQLDDFVSRRLADVEHFIKQRQARKEELKMIVETLVKENRDFAYGGHFYRCPNGHAFTIGDCGGAMELSRCPECGATIGGTGHNLAADNSRDDEMEEIARDVGAQPSPWPWGRAR